MVECVIVNLFNSERKRKSTPKEENEKKQLTKVILMNDVNSLPWVCILNRYTIYSRWFKTKTKMTNTHIRAASKENVCCLYIYLMLQALQIIS